MSDLPAIAFLSAAAAIITLWHYVGTKDKEIARLRSLTSTQGHATALPNEDEHAGILAIAATFNEQGREAIRRADPTLFHKRVMLPLNGFAAGILKSEMPESGAYGLEARFLYENLEYVRAQIGSALKAFDHPQSNVATYTNEVIRVIAAHYARPDQPQLPLIRSRVLPTSADAVIFYRATIEAYNGKQDRLIALLARAAESAQPAPGIETMSTAEPQATTGDSPSMPKLEKITLI